MCNNFKFDQSFYDLFGGPGVPGFLLETTNESEPSVILEFGILPLGVATFLFNNVLFAAEFSAGFGEPLYLLALVLYRFC